MFETNLSPISSNGQSTESSDSKHEVGEIRGRSFSQEHSSQLNEIIDKTAHSTKGILPIEEQNLLFDEEKEPLNGKIKDETLPIAYSVTEMLENKPHKGFPNHSITYDDDDFGDESDDELTSLSQKEETQKIAKENLSEEIESVSDKIFEETKIVNEETKIVNEETEKVNHEAEKANQETEILSEESENANTNLVVEEQAVSIALESEEAKDFKIATINEEKIQIVGNEKLNSNPAHIILEGKNVLGRQAIFQNFSNLIDKAFLPELEKKNYVYFPEAYQQNKMDTFDEFEDKLRTMTDQNQGMTYVNHAVENFIERAKPVVRNKENKLLNAEEFEQFKEIFTVKLQSHIDEFLVIIQQIIIFNEILRKEQLKIKNEEKETGVQFDQSNPKKDVHYEKSLQEHHQTVQETKKEQNEFAKFEARVIVKKMLDDRTEQQINTQENRKQEQIKEKELEKERKRTEVKKESIENDNKKGEYNKNHVKGVDEAKLTKVKIKEFSTDSNHSLKVSEQIILTKKPSPGQNVS